MVRRLSKKTKRGYAKGSRQSEHERLKKYRDTVKEKSSEAVKAERR